MNSNCRTLHLLDVENLAGTGRLDRPETEACLAAYDRVTERRTGDHVVVATNPFIALDAGLAVRNARLLTRHGKDGADVELLAVLHHERVAERFGSVVIASGDGIFTEAVIALTAADVHVEVVGRRGHISKRLMMAATTVTYIDEQRTEPATQAATTSVTAIRKAA